MQKQFLSHSIFVTLRGIAILLVCGVACSMLTGTLLGFLSSESSSKSSIRTLTFAERVEYQRATEDIYWRHRIWPKENPDPKPALNAVMSQTQLEKKVADYLLKSQALEDYWQRPITGEQLQAEMDRMAKDTKQPEVLRELFDALGNDPVVVAECLARPALTERLSVYSVADEVKQPSRTVNQFAAATASYTIPKISGTTGGCVDDTWIPTGTVNAPTARAFHKAVWTGSEMIIWGGDDGINLFNTGGKYNPSTDSWVATSTINAPTAATGPSAVWTGSEVIVWGGTAVNTGGRYNPATNSWIPTSTTNAPKGRGNHTAIWTGSDMIIWGGVDFMGSVLKSGGKYNPNTNSWSPTTTVNAPEARTFHTAVWTGSDMIIWGGWNGGSTHFNSGGRYDPSTDSWTATQTSNAPVGRSKHTAVWTGNEMIVWGGEDINIAPLNTGGKYNPITDSWTATSTTSAPDPRKSHTAVWTTDEMVIWGGLGASGVINTGGRFSPDMDSWTPTSTTGAPTAREFHTAVWTDTEMIIWGGVDFSNSIYFNTGGRYCAQSAPTPSPTPTPGMITVTVKTTPTSRSFSVDGTTYTMQQRFMWTSGSTHTIATTSPQSGGTGVQYVWTKWSDHGAISHTVAPTTNTTYTATFKTQYFLTMAHGTGGMVSPASGWKNSGIVVSISATPGNGFSFSAWTGTGAGSYSGPNNPASITMGGPITETAIFTHN